MLNTFDIENTDHLESVFSEYYHDIAAHIYMEQLASILGVVFLISFPALPGMLSRCGWKDLKGESLSRNQRRRANLIPMCSSRPPKSWFSVNEPETRFAIGCLPHNVVGPPGLACELGEEDDQKSFK
jgi:hypothetical protein